MQSLQKTFLRYPAVALALVFLAIASPVQAGAFNMGGLTATLSIDHVTQAERARSINEQVFAEPLIAQRPQAEPIVTRYARSAARTQQNLRNFVARTPDPAARANLEQMFAAQPKLMEEISAGAKSFGFDPYDVADAYAMWWMNAWLVANKRDEVPDNGTIAMVKNQVRNAFAATPDFAKTSDADRQEYAEALLLQATMLGSMFEQWKNDPKMLDQLADAARKGAEASGLDLSMMILTRNGFVPREGADASGAGAGEDPVRNARADALAGESDSSPLGLALAAGAGLGATLLGGFAFMRRG